MFDIRDLEILFRSGAPLICCKTSDEQRILRLVQQSAFSSGKDAWRWTCVAGLQRLDYESEAQTALTDPERLLQHIRKLTQPGVFALLDFHPFLSEAKHVRLLKEIALESDRLRHTLVFVSHDFTIPSELAAFTIDYQLTAPSTTEVTQILREEAQRYLASSHASSVQANLDNVQLLINSLRGLPEADVRRLARSAIENDGAITDSDIAQVLEAKRSLLQRDGIMEFEYDTATFAEVAGLTRLKEWITLRSSSMQGKNPENSVLPPPKGVLLLGVQGCGKSLAAKAIAGVWKLPLLRFDMGAVFNKYIGETERRIRDALKNADVLAPCVLWIDELEKGIASTDFDGGTAQRVLGTILTWMAERDAPVFLVATANNVDGLPPELLRKGRFDEIFFVDLPTAAIREELFKIHLKRRTINPSALDLQALIAATEGFSGAEVEQLVVAALYSVHGKPEKVTAALLLDEAARTRPLSCVMSEKVNALRAWALDRCVKAD
jgi:SpoVK/Ycf46/Vps4 family AAA+-type ATPase